jgi:hypothetical protein
LTKRFELKNDIPKNSKNTWGRIFPDEEDGPTVDIESLELDKCLQRKIIRCYYLSICKDVLPSARAFRMICRCIADKGRVDDLWRCDGNRSVLQLLGCNIDTGKDVKDYKENERTRDGDLPNQS